MSNETKWTNGPWEVDSRARTCVKGGKPPRSVATCGGWSDNRLHPDDIAGEQQANAQLIAAAPDLYDALCEALDELEAIAAAEVGEQYHNPRINAALAKARGEQP